MDIYQFRILQKRDAGIPLSPVEKQILYQDLEPYMRVQLQKYDMMREIQNRNKVLIDRDELEALIKKAAADVTNDVTKALNSIDIG